jgi:Restriction endonuclease BglII
MTIDDLPAFIKDHYEIHEWRHASAVLARDFPQEWNDIISVLAEFRLCKSYITTPGGGKSKVSIAIDNAFFARGWVEKSFETSIVVDGIKEDSPTHSVDYYKNHIAIETEWNNKNPFYDRDLNNFRLLFDLRVISAGVIITRCDELQDIFDELGRGPSYGQSTTHMRKLLPLINGGAGGGCPLLVLGISKRLYDPNA